MKKLYASAEDRRAAACGTQPSPCCTWPSERSPGGLGFFVGHAWRDPFFAKQPTGFGDAIVPADAMAGVVALIQVVRTPRSLARHASGAEPTPHRPSALLAGGGHTAIAAALLLLAGLGWLTALLASKIR